MRQVFAACSPVERKGIRKEYFHYLIPTIISQVAHTLYCLGDVFFVGLGVGSDGLAALNVALPIFTLFTCFSIMMGVGTATTISIFRGQGEEAKIHKTFTLSLVVLLAGGLLFTVLTSVFIREIALLFGATDRIVDYVVDYLKPITRLAVVYIFSAALSVIVRSDGNPRLVMAAGIAGNLSNIVLDYIFVICLHMGIFGAGLATIIGPCVSVLILSLHFMRGNNRIYLSKKFFSFSLLLRVFRNGIGSSILEISAGFIILLFNIVILSVSGETAVAVFSIISNIAYVGKGIFGGMAQAAQPIISQSYGAQNFAVVRVVNSLAMKTALFFSLAVYGIILLFPGPIISLFISSDPQILAIGIPANIIYFLSFPFTGLNTILMYYFQSLERSLYTTLIAMFRGVILVYCFLMLFSHLWGILGVWFSLVAAEGLTFLIFYPIKLRFEQRCFKPQERLAASPDSV